MGNHRPAVMHPDDHRIAYADYYRFCCWPFCKQPLFEGVNLPLCQTHALHIWLTVGDDVKAVGQSESDVRQARAEAKKREGRVESSYFPPGIYYLQMGDHLKIGYSANLERRMRSYPPPPTSSLLAWHEGTMKDEQNLHRTFSPLRVAKREWYRFEGELRQHVERVGAGWDVQMANETMWGGRDPITGKFKHDKKYPQAVQVRSRSGGSYSRR